MKKLLDAHGVYYFFPVGSGYGHAGVPDIVCCHKGLFIGIECKAGKNKTTALQDFELHKIRTAGGIAVVVYEADLPALEDILCTISSGRCFR